jgi:hypothetical protein
MMAGIYERDNINYPSIMAAVAQARARDAERRGEYINQQGQLWGNTAKNLVNTAGRAVVGHMDNGPESWSYVADGDRSGLDRIRAEELAKKEREAQQDWQWKKMEAEHAHAEKLAKAQREAQKSFEMDKMLKSYKDSIAMRDALKATGDPNDPMINAKIAQLENEITFYGDRLGLNTKKNGAPQPQAGQVAEESAQGQEGTEDSPYKTRASRDKRWSEIEGKVNAGTYTDEDAKLVQELIENEDRDDIKNSRQIDSKSWKTREQKKVIAERKELKDLIEYKNKGYKLWEKEDRFNELAKKYPDLVGGK